MTSVLKCFKTLITRKKNRVSTLPVMPPDTKKCNGAVPRVPPTSAPTETIAGPPPPPATTTPATTVAPGPVPLSVCNGTHSPQPHSTPAKRSIHDYYFGKTLGEGSFSTVWLVRDIHTKKDYALKQCDKAHIVRERKTESIKREKQVLNILSETGAPFCVKLYCTFQDPEKLFFVITYAKNGELLTHINRNKRLSVDCARFYAAELVVALEHLRRVNVIHRDLKPENILLDENMHVLVTDFGCAKIVHRPQSGTDSDDESARSRRNSFVGTAQYISPELLTDKNASFSSDLWALGCIIYQMLTGQPPFQSRSEYLIFQKIQKLEYEFPDNFDPTAEDLIRKLLVLNPTERLGASDEEGYPSIRSHPFFTNTPWNSLASTPPPTVFSDPTHRPAHNDNWVTSDMKPGLDNSQLSRILGLDQGQAPVAPPAPRPQAPPQQVARRKKSYVQDLTEAEIQRRLALQKAENKWHDVVEGNLIIKQGFIDKRKSTNVVKGVLSRKTRMLFLTLGPHLYYADPETGELKGEFGWTSELKVRARTFKTFYLYCNGLKGERTYSLQENESHALEWIDAIDEMHRAVFGKKAIISST
ncbi:putative 3-phosphoinositide-dependent protein kinase 2 isoform X2 [Homalodisca vitripennis]|uniref:putative 3-phosphoinositide-dependent protein kinase 2 isoform X2 n=1 Tax=Homalodisca vitripennis TaxID=197043 RepID=UPI001EEB1DCE|nr:putative 3-phosphoinositide-dependent protein kinase 2 isoform X2 [Homalodisca vitripennis]